MAFSGRSATPTFERTYLPTPPVPDAPPSRARQAWVASAVALIAVSACALIFFNGFTQDDASLLVASQRFASFSGWRSLFTEPFWPAPALPDLYRPLHG